MHPVNEETLKPYETIAATLHGQPSGEVPYGRDVGGYALPRCKNQQGSSDILLYSI